MARYRIVQQCQKEYCDGTCCPVTTAPAGTMVQVLAGDPKAVENLQVGDVVKIMHFVGYLAVKEAPTLEPE